MALEREDIDWGKLRLIIAKFKYDFGSTEDGKLCWTSDFAENFVAELREKILPVSSVADEGSAVSEGDSNVACKEHNVALKRKVPDWMVRKETAVKKKKKF